MTQQCRRHRRLGFDPWVGKIPWRRKWQPTLVFLPGKSHGRIQSMGVTKELDTVEQFNNNKVIIFNIHWFQ